MIDTCVVAKEISEIKVKTDGSSAQKAPTIDVDEEAIKLEPSTMAATDA